MRVVCISDTHQHEPEVPQGDLLIHAGDLTMMGEERAVRRAFDWLDSLPHQHKVVVAGNHDFFLQAARGFHPESVTYLLDEWVLVEGLKVWGSPWQPWFRDWAFNLPRGPEIRAKWDLIPNDTDILVTHGPPAGVLDRTDHGLSVGCEDLWAAVLRVRPRLHVFGHIHEARGEYRKALPESADATIFVNAAACDRRYRLANTAIVVDL